MRSVKEMKAMGSYGTIGMEIVLSVLFGLFIGKKLDDWLGTEPWLTLVWFGFGCAAGGRAVYRSYKQMQIAAKREEEVEGNPPQQFPDERSLEWRREEGGERGAGGQSAGGGETAVESERGGAKERRGDAS